MNDGYLWDRSGDPDAEVQTLEELLGRYRSAAAHKGEKVHVTPAAVAFARIKSMHAWACVGVRNATMAQWPAQALKPVADDSAKTWKTSRQRTAAAEPLYRRLMALREEGKLDENWDSSLANWAHLLAATGRTAEAARAQARIASSSPAPPPS